MSTTSPRTVPSVSDDRRADDLVPVELAARELLARGHHGLQIDVAQRLGRGSVRNLGEAHPPALSVRLGLDDGQGRVAALDEEALADRESLVGPVGQRFHADCSSQPVEAPDLAYHQPLAGAHSARLS